MKTETDRRAVLVVEDSDDDFDTVVASAKLAGIGNSLVRAVDADAAAALLAGPSARDYAFMLLDFKLPGRDGLSLLREVRRDPRLAQLPTVIFTTSSNPGDRDSFYGAGANAFHVKAVQYPACLCTLQSIFDYWLNRVVLPQGVDSLSR